MCLMEVVGPEYTNKLYRQVFQTPMASTPAPLPPHPKPTAMPYEGFFMAN